MTAILEFFGGVLMVFGALFLLLGSLGLVRMPDLYNRIQAGTKTTTLGSLLTLAGTALIRPSWVLELSLIGLFLLFTNPLSSQVLARSAHQSGVPQTDSAQADHLAERDRHRHQGEPS